MAHTAALITTHLPIPGLMQTVIGYVWDPDVEDSFVAACEGGYHEICSAKMCGLNVDRGLVAACRGGHINIARLMITRGADRWNSALYEACTFGHADITHLMIEQGASDLHTAMLYVIRGNHEDVKDIIWEYMLRTQRV